MKLPLLDSIVFFALTLGNIILGASFYFRNKTTDQFTAGGRSLPAWVVGMSIFATFVSSISFLGLPGKAYATNWNAFVFSLSISLRHHHDHQVLHPALQGIGNISAYYYLEQRFGAWARIYASILLHTDTADVVLGAILMLLALPLNALFGWEIKTVDNTYGINGNDNTQCLAGIKAVILTDAIQV
jgi:SSS family solute:Na+ symporter